MSLMVFALCFLTGCSAGSTIETILEINKDLSGYRQMDLVVDQTVYDEYFTGSVEDLNALISENCPKEMTWSQNELNGATVYRFRIDFTDSEDYENKVKNIINSENEIETVITDADSIWASGIFISENYNSEQLMDWLKTAIVDAQYVSESNRSMIFTSGSNTVRYIGKEYAAYGNIQIDEIEYLDIKSIELFTDMSGFDSYDKSIVLTIPEESMNLKGEDIKAWLGERLPTGAEGTWETVDTDSIYTVTKAGLTAIQLENFLNEYFDSEKCSVIQEEIKEGQSPFSFNVELTEYVDFTNFIVGERAYMTDVVLYVRGHDGYVGGKYLDTLANYDQQDDMSDKYPGYRPNYSDMNDSSVYMFSSNFQKVYRLSDVSVESEMKAQGNMARKAIYTFAEEPSEEEKIAILEKIDQRSVFYDEVMKEYETEILEDTETEEVTENQDSATDTNESGISEESTAKDSAWNVTIEEEIVDGIYRIVISQEGNRREIKASTYALYGYEGDLYSAKAYNFAKMTCPIAIYDNVSLGSFVDYTTDNFTSNYVLNMGPGSKIKYVNSDYQESEIEGKYLTIYSPDLNGIDIVCYGTQFNIWALVFYSLIALAIVSLVILLKQIGVFEKIKTIYEEKRNEKLAAMEISKQSTSENVLAEDNPRASFCENCGAPRDEDALVCTQCGVKFTEEE